MKSAARFEIWIEFPAGSFVLENSTPSVFMNDSEPKFFLFFGPLEGWMSSIRQTTTFR